MESFVQGIIPDFLRGPLIAVSYLGKYPVFQILIAVILLFLVSKKMNRAAVILLLAMISEGFLSYYLKQFIHEARPQASLVQVFEKLNDFSFPSGHAFSFTVLFGFCAYLSHKFIKFICLLMIVSVGVSRIYLGEHFVSDVLGGYLLGLILLYAAVKLYNKK